MMNSQKYRWHTAVIRCAKRRQAIYAALVLLPLLSLNACSSHSDPTSDTSKAAKSSAAAPTQTSTNWDGPKAKAIHDGDQGEKAAYECRVTSSGVNDIYTGNYAPAAADIPDLGVSKKSDQIVVIKATGVEKASAILHAAWSGKDSLRTECDRAQAIAKVSATDRPFETYEPVTGDVVPLLGQYFAVRHEAIDYASLAASYDTDYKQEQDGFKKKDKLAAFTAQLNTAIEKAKANPYLVLPPLRESIPAYDFDSGSYDLTKLFGADMRVHLANGHMEMRYADASLLAHYKPADESEARRIEDLVSKRGALRDADVVLYGKVVGADQGINQPYLIFAITRADFTTVDSYKNPSTPLFSVTAE